MRRIRDFFADIFSLLKEAANKGDIDVSIEQGDFTLSGSRQRRAIRVWEASQADRDEKRK